MVHPWMKELTRETFSRYDVMTVGETSATSPEDAKLWAGYHTGGAEHDFPLDHMGVDNDPNGSLGGKWSYAPYKLTELKRILNDWQTTLEGNAWGSLYWDNHDQPRVVSRSVTIRMSSAPCPLSSWRPPCTSCRAPRTSTRVKKSA